MTVKAHLNNIILCYHGCVSQRHKALTFREHINDFKAHVQHLKEAGYTFVKPSQYYQWQSGAWQPGYPIACIELDDGLESVKLILPWLAEHQVPYGLAIIGRRQRVHLPETDFASWQELSSYVAAGYCELMNHTYNMHHLAVGSSTGETRPVMDGPPWVDNGEVVYQETGDTRPYWDFSLIDGVTWGFPLFGSDPATFTLDGGKVVAGATPVTSSFTFKARVTQTVSVMRFWAVLHVPYGAGYDAQVKITSGSTVLFNGVIKPKDYETRSQWPEREHVSIVLTTPLSVTAGNSYMVTFETLNAGPGLFRCAAIPDFSGDYSLVSNTVSLKPGISSGEGIIDYPANKPWPARLAVILGDGTGVPFDEVQYYSLVQADLQKNQDVIRDYLDAVWTYHNDGVNQNAPRLGVAVAFGTYSDGTLADSRFRVDFSTPHKAYTLRWKFVNYTGEWYPIVADIFVGTSNSGPWTKIARCAPNYHDYHWQEIDLEVPYDFSAGTYWFRFQTLNQSPHPGATLLRIYNDSPFPDSSLFAIQTGHYTNGGPVLYDAGKLIDDINNHPANLSLIARSYFSSIEGGDIWPEGIFKRWRHGNWFYYYGAAYSGGMAFIETASVQKSNAATPDEMVYPFGAFYSVGTGSTEIKKIDDVNPQLKTAMAAVGLNRGTTIWPRPNRVSGGQEEPGARHTEWTQGRLLIYGDITPGLSLNNISAYAGSLWEDAGHLGIEWQTSIEPDIGGNSTVRYNYAALSFMAFDAWFFNPAGGLFKSQLQDGGYYLALDNFSPGFVAGDVISGSVSGATATIVWSNEDVNNPVLKIQPLSGVLQAGETVTTSPATGQGDIDNWGVQHYPDDKGFLQVRGIKCLLIISNYNYGLGDVDPALASTVVNNPANYLTDVINAIVDEGFDGVTINLEAVPAADREAASNFIISVANEMHSRHLLCHMTAPAKTGTSYDSQSWVGWCDHGRLVRYVDALKIMSYTESGDWSSPAPHAPDWFWQAVYDFTDRVIPANFKRRILCGCNAHSDIWGDGPNTYQDFHTALAMGLLRGAYIEKKDGEGHWASGALEAYMGTPETMTRAAREAVVRGYGGLGAWKADDGDKFMHWPVAKQVGRYDNHDIHPATLPEFLYGLIGFSSVRANVDEKPFDHHEASLTFRYFKSHLQVNDRRITVSQADELVHFVRALAKWQGRFRFISPVDCQYSVTMLADGEQRTFSTGFPVRSVLNRINSLSVPADVTFVDKGQVVFYQPPAAGSLVELYGVRWHWGRFLNWPRFKWICDGVFEVSLEIIEA